MTINEKISKIRTLMNSSGIDTYIITKSDPHQSEDSENFYQSILFISGFTGSNATVVITQKEACLWTDGRYYIQAASQLSGTEFILQKSSEPTTKTFLQYAFDETKTSGTIGFDGTTLSLEQTKFLLKIISTKSISLKTDVDLVGDIWQSRPPLSTKPVFNHLVKYCGKSRLEKISNVQMRIKEENCDGHILSSLDDIAWLFNLRGNDIANNMTFTAYAYISTTESILFINSEKLSDVINILQEENIKIMDYSEIFSFVKTLPDNSKILIKPAKTNYNLYKSGSHLSFMELDFNFTETMKAVKNPTELENLEKVNIRDGVAMVRSIKEIKERANNEITELDVDTVFKLNRKRGDNFLKTSFDTIAGYNANGAMMHYRATAEAYSTIKPEGFLLVDSGGQYLDGTTDITRTIALGPLTKNMIEDFTLVLKSHIAIATAKFLYGATGSKIDMLGRIPMWNVGKNYSCGTGHGIGFCLCVHEGPHSMSFLPNPVRLEEGMVLTNEPGIYVENKYGIRTENTIVVTKDKIVDNDTFLKFNTISYCPIEINAIDKSMLTDAEINWINSYHETVYNKLSPYLNEDELVFLKNETRAI